ncbi:MAG: hypothetical protein MZV63_61585 [Marinilabiliales bacterium]|nr:hypothetical protein [Marinilabiliales bacterium]
MKRKGYTYGINSVAGAFHGLGYIAIMTEVAKQLPRGDGHGNQEGDTKELCRNEVGQ